MMDESRGFGFPASFAFDCALGQFYCYLFGLLYKFFSPWYSL